MAAKPNKTQATAASVSDYLAGLEPASRRADAEALCALMGKVSGAQARLWGPSIIGFGVRHYQTDAGRKGEILKIGFAPRKPEFVLYGLGASANAEALVPLGKFTTGKGCVYIKRLTDIDLTVLTRLLERAWAS